MFTLNGQFLGLYVREGPHWAVRAVGGMASSRVYVFILPSYVAVERWEIEIGCDSRTRLSERRPRPTGLVLSV